MQLFDPAFKTRRWLKVGLTIGGALAGAAFGIVLTRLGKIIAEAPPATPGNYARNAAVFGVIAAIVSPVVSWTTLRRVPLWRTILEPLAFALAGGTAAVVAGIPSLLLALPPIGLTLGFAHLARRYHDPHLLPSTQPGNERHTSDP